MERFHYKIRNSTSVIIIPFLISITPFRIVLTPLKKKSVFYDSYNNRLEKFIFVLDCYRYELY